MYPSKSVQRPWKSVSVSGSRLDLFRGCFLPLYFFGLETFPLFPSVGIFNPLPSGGRDGFYSTINPPFLDIFLVLMLNSRFVCAVIHTGLKRLKYVLILLLVVFWIYKNKKSDIQDKSPVTTFCPSIVLYGITIRHSTSEYFPIKGCSLLLYDHFIKCHNTWGDMSEMPSMYGHSNDNIQGTSSTLIHMCKLTLNCLRAKYVHTI